MGRYGGKVLLRGGKVLVKGGFVAFLVVCVVFASLWGEFYDIRQSRQVACVVFSV
jgi:hypothetical protein